MGVNWEESFMAVKKYWKVSQVVVVNISDNFNISRVITITTSDFFFLILFDSHYRFTIHNYSILFH